MKNNDLGIQSKKKNAFYIGTKKWEITLKYRHFLRFPTNRSERVRVIHNNKCEIKYMNHVMYTANILMLSKRGIKIALPNWSFHVTTKRLLLLTTVMYCVLFSHYTNLIET